MNYNGKKFKVWTNSDNGSTSEETIFQYWQKGRLVWADYQGGKILMGNLMGVVAENGTINMHYHQIEEGGKIKTGVCTSVPEILEDGRIRLHESWKWTCDDFSIGNSVIEEI